MDTQKAVQETGEEKTPVTTPPVVEQTTQPEVVTEVPDTAEKPDKTPEEVPSTEGETEELPDDKSEQGRAFAEMRRKIKDLEVKVKERDTRQSSFDTIRNITPPPPVVQVDPSQFVDPTTGAFNKPAYDVALNQANVHNNQVQRQIANETVEYKFDEYRARQKYPSLNTNKRFERAVAAEYQTRLLETIGNPTAPQPKIEEIADEYAPFFATDQKKVIQKATAEVKQQLTEKEQASLSASGRSQPAITNSDLDNLRARSRQGDKDAIAERLRRLH